jgi:hypothetical protein
MTPYFGRELMAARAVRQSRYLHAHNAGGEHFNGVVSSLARTIRADHTASAKVSTL